MEIYSNNKIMKYTLIILCVFFLGCNTYKKTTLKSHILSVGYISIKELKGDTLSYLNKNFIDNKSNYVGKEFNVLLVDLEFEIKKCTASISANNRYIIPGINISFDTPTNIYLKGKSGTKTYHLQIDWEQPMQSDAVWKFMKETNYDGWSDLHKKFFGNQIIKDIRVIVL